MTLNANQFLDAIKATGTDPMGRGCIMLDTIEPIVTEADFEKATPYYSKHPDRFFIKGIVGDKEAHVTLLYGLLESGNTWRESVDAVLKGWEPEDLIIDTVSFFPSAFEDEEYICIIAKLKVTENLAEAHARLSFLPHIDTHPEYKPHITLGYVKDTGTHMLSVLLRDLNFKLRGERIRISSDLNYGR